jgi:hypothetical protein
MTSGCGSYTADNTLLIAWNSMVKLLKVIACILIVVAILAGALLLWFDRYQDIDFAIYQPDYWVTCNGKISKDSVEYDRLNKWLKLNSSHWQNYVATAAHGYFYKSEKITIYVHRHGVVVIYHDGQNWFQVHKSIDTDGIFGVCNSS